MRWAASPSSVTPGTRSHRCPIGRACERARDRRGLAVGDQRGELRRPAVELRGDPSRRRGGVGEVDAGEPLLRLGQRDVGVQDAAGSRGGPTIPLPGASANMRPAADRLRAGGVARVGVEQVGLDERGADVLGLGVGQQRPDPRPGAVRADQEARWSTVEPSAKVSSCRPVAEGADAGDLASPLDGAGRAASRAGSAAGRRACTSGRPPVPSSGWSSSTVPCWSSTRVASPPSWMMRAELVGQAGRLRARAARCTRGCRACRPACAPSARRSAS